MNQQTAVSINLEGLGDITEFTSLTIHQTLGDTCNGSFGYRDAGSKTLKGQIRFHDDVMGKSVTINIGPDFTFKGFIDSVRMHNEDGLASEYMISFVGDWGKLDYHPECHGWADKKFNDIIKEIAKGVELADLPTDSAINAKELYWTVQQNKTRWQQIKFMAAREGAWLYYDGQQMHMAAPSERKLTLTKGVSIFNITHSKSTVASPVNFTGFNTFAGELLMATIEDADAPDIHKSAVSSGATLVTAKDGSVHIGTAFDDEQLKRKAKLYQKSKTANSVVFTATTYDSGVTVGTVLKVEEGNSSNDSYEFIVTQVAHNAATNSSYTAYLTMIPATVEVPPYTNPFLYTPADRVHGIVMDNHDKKHKKDRVQVNLPWMPKGSKTNWMDVLTNYAGKGKGHVWLPEVNEEVLVDFVSGDVERPFVAGALFTQANLSGRETDEGNHIKSTTTGSGRGFVIDDKKGKVRFQDNTEGTMPNNALVLIRNDEESGAQLQSAEDDRNFSFVHLIGKSGATIKVIDDGAVKYEITLDKDVQKIKIRSAGSIELIADDSISLQAPNININASKSLKLSGTSDGVKMEGQKVEISAQTDIKATANANLDLSGMQAKLVGNVQAELSSGALVKVQGAIVQIN